MHPDLTAIRSEYARQGLDEGDVDPSPMRQIERWVGEAIAAEHPEPTAMTLATASPDGEPSARVVLLRGVDARGLVFFTNYESAKGRDLARNPRACANLFWALLQRQVRVTGAVERLPAPDSDAYFRARPRESQLGAWASEQSAVIAGRGALDARLADARARFAGREVPRPPHWGGLRVIPARVELWQGRPSRLHDRLCYVPDGDHRWRVERLAP